MKLFLVLFMGISAYVYAFTCSLSHVRLGSHLRTLQMLSEEEGYGPAGSLIRQGPVPYLIRLVKPDTYEAAVNKYMAKEKCSKLEAMANMDAYFMDPNGWAAQKIREKKGAPKVDYVNQNVSKQQLVLTGVWAVGIIGLFVRIAQVQLAH